LGDSPRGLAAATYIGLTFELPISFGRIEGGDGGTKATIAFEAKAVETLAGDGHYIVVTGIGPKGQVDLGRARLRENSATLDVDFAPLGDPPYKTFIKLRVDTEVGFGLMDDFILTRIKATSTGLAPDRIN
jgi:hypothetical protein